MKNSSLTLLLCCLPIFALFAQSITSVTPGTAIQGQTLQVTISGQSTFFTQTSTTSWISQGVVSIHPTNTVVQNYSTINATYSIPGNAGVGYWDMHVMEGFNELIKLDAIFIDEFIGVDPRGATVKESIQLGPNPLRDEAVLHYALPSKAWVNIEMKNLQGGTVAHIYTGHQAPGSHTQQLRVSDLGLASGAYFLTLQVDDMVFAVKATVVR